MAKVSNFTKFSRAGLAIVKGTIELGRFSIPYRIYESEGPHIICLNGVQQSMAMWHTFVESYTPHYRVVLFDFPNQGKGKVVSGPLLVTLDEQVDILHKVIKATGTNKSVSLCAASWGGVIAMAFAAKYHGQVKQLCLASLGTKANDTMVETIKKGIAVDSGNRQEMADILINSFGQNLPESIKNKIVKQFHSMSQENLNAFYEHGLAVVSAKKIGSLIKLSNIREKTFLIYGEKDTIIDLEDVKFLSSQIPDCEIRIVKGAGHFLHMEKKDAFDIYKDILPVPACKQA
ncbi:MAG: alpha/beta hydrolase [Candidatus Omnitrophica bacterium]|nr:alpha/beta hydrolase [Candidatus Omnitrophota bacterium]MDD5430446.1 alpha/beta hydrolase [Candidatus Omnitrophota bacterium]